VKIPKKGDEKEKFLGLCEGSASAPWGKKGYSSDSDEGRMARFDGETERGRTARWVSFVKRELEITWAHGRRKNLTKFCLKGGRGLK